MIYEFKSGPVTITLRAENAEEAYSFLDDKLDSARELGIDVNDVFNLTFEYEES